MHWVTLLSLDYYPRSQANYFHWNLASLHSRATYFSSELSSSSTFGASVFHLSILSPVPSELNIFHCSLALVPSEPTIFHWSRDTTILVAGAIDFLWVDLSVKTQVYTVFTCSCFTDAISYKHKATSTKNNHFVRITYIICQLWIDELSCLVLYKM